MTKLTVAEASKRGYATGLSILQAVQKNWLSAEKSADGQILVDVADLEQIFGTPRPPVPASMPRAHGADDRPSVNANSTDVVPPPSSEIEDEADESQDQKPKDNAARAVPAATFDSPVEAPPAATKAPEAPQPAVQVDADANDRGALLAEIERLRGDLDNERRHVAALLDVLSNRMPASAGNDADAEPVETAIASAGDTLASSAPRSLQPEEDSTWHQNSPAAPWHDDTVSAENAADELSADWPAEAVVLEKGAGAALPEDTLADLGTPDVPKASILEECAASEATNEDWDEDFAPPPYHSGVTEPEGSDARESIETDAHDDIAMPEPQHGDGLAMPKLSPDDRPIFGARAKPQMARTGNTRPSPKRGSYFWKLWQLMSLVWIALIGAFYWFVLDLQTDLAVTGNWIRGDLAGDAPAVQDAGAALLDAARDIFGPPVLLLVAILVIRALYRAIRR